MLEEYNNPNQKRPWLLQSKLRLFVSLFLLLALPGGVLTALVATHVQDQIKTQAIQQNTIIARIVARNLDDQFYRLRKEVEEFTTRTRLIEFAGKRDAENTRLKLAEFLKISPAFSRAFVADTNGTLVTDLPLSEELIGKNFAERDWFKGASQRSDAYVSEIYQRTRDAANVITVACRIRDANGDTVGFLCGQLTMERLLRWIEEIKPSSGGPVILLDQSRRTVTRTKASAGEISQNAMLQQIRNTGEGHLFAKNGKGEEALVSFVPVGSIGWTAAAMQPTSTFFAPLRALLQTIAIFFSICFAATAIIGLYWFNTILKFEAHRERAGEELRTYANHLKRSNEELESLCYSIAHDLRAPLRALRGFALALREEYDTSLDDAGRDYTKRIGDAAHRMDELTQDLLDYGRLGHLELPLQRVDLDSTLKKVLPAFAPELNKQNACLDIRHPLPCVRGNETVLQQVFSNLLSNALKFVKPGFGPQIRIWAEEDGSNVIVKVQDNGIGIDAEHHKKIFGVFERLHHHDVYPGTGIGLAIVRKGIDRLGGQVGLESKVNEGSCFWFQLPKA